MARTPAQRGPFGRWLTRVRSERYERQVDALEAMRKLAGLHISQAEYSQWEAGSRVPRPDNPKVARLYEFFGSQPDGEPEPADQSALIGVLARLADAMEAQTRVLEAQKGELAGYADGVQGLLARLVAEHVDNGVESSPRRAGSR